MAHLAFLPTELLSRICEFIEPADFVSFSLVNRRFQAVTKPFEAYHHERWNKYAILQDRTNTGYWFWHNVLRSVLEGWQGTMYVKILKVSYSGDIPGRDAPSVLSSQFMHDWDCEEQKDIIRPNQTLPQQILQGIPDRSEIPEEHRRLIMEAYRTLPWFTKDDLDQALSELHKTSFILALLVSLLPGLQKVSIARFSGEKLYYLKKAVSHAVFSLSTTTTDYVPLSRLTEVDFTTVEGEDSELPDYPYCSPGDFDSSFLLPFLSLPSIQSLKAAQIIGHESQAANLPPSKLEHLTLRDLAIPMQKLSSILVQSTNLKSCELKTKTTSSDFNPAAVIDALAMNASNTLQELTLHAGFPHPDSTLDRRMSLANFSALIHLDITYDSLCPPQSADTTIVFLPDALPASLKTLKIHSHQFRAGFAPNILALLTEKPPQQAVLEYLLVEGWMRENDKKAMQQACQERKIQFKGNQSTRHGFVPLPIPPTRLSGARISAARTQSLLYTVPGPKDSRQ